jgi:hypothetical protein
MLKREKRFVHFQGTLNLGNSISRVGNGAPSVKTSWIQLPKERKEFQIKVVLGKGINCL